MSSSSSANGPFALDDDHAYAIWRERKLAQYPEHLEELVVEVADPRALTDTEHTAILQRCRKTNMAIYASHAEVEDQRSIPLALGRQFGLSRLDHNWLADPDGLTPLAVADTALRQHYIPYTDRPIKWHTDGYYNAEERQIHALLLHCVSPAAHGGENALMDHEVAYILLRDQNPDYIRALMATDAMTIPARMDQTNIARPDESGPVFSVDPRTGDLHMRYTARTHNVHWKKDDTLHEAVTFLESLLDSNLPYIYRGRLEPGMGLISNNVLHDRAGFSDDETTQRLLYRARYYDRIAGTSLDLSESF